MIIKYIKYNTHFLILLASWLVIVFSISAKPPIFFYKQGHLLENLESLRLTFAIIISFTFITISIHKLFKVGFVSIIFILYCISQIIGLFENNDKIFNLENLYLIILSLGSLSIIFYISQSKDNKNLKNFLFITIGIFFIISIFLLFSAYKSHGLNSLYIYTLIPPDKQIADTINLSYPRITGLARNLSIANILIIILLIQKKMTLKKKLSLFVAATILGILIWSAQSRGAILCYFFVLFVIIIFCKQKLLNKVIYLILFISLPIMVFNISKQFYENSYINKKNLISETSPKPFTDSRFKVLKNNDSGRTSLWISSFKLYNKSKIFGYGPQGDRFLLPEKTTEGYGNSVSNGFIYAFLSGGYVGFLLFSILVIYFLNILYKNLFITNIFKSDNSLEKQISTAIIFFFCIRILFENSFSLFGIDQMLILISSFILQKKKNK